jgi:competence protein ComEC
VILGIIAVYVPVAGAGASIQRAGVMGAAGIVAALAQRPRSRAYAIALAAVVTLALDPRAAADIGWQLSFAAVLGIMAGSAPIAAALAGDRDGWRRGLADAAALTLAATLATAPLLAHHFDAVSVVSLPANLVALPAVAPVMWLGMLAGALGQVGWIPVEPLTWLAGVFAGYIAQVAEWFAAPAWAQAGLELTAAEALLGFGVLGLLTTLAVRWLRRRRGLRSAGSTTRRRRRTLVALAAAIAVAVAAGWPTPPPSGAPDLRVSVLDVGQGDAILLEPAKRSPLLIDAGPPGAEVASQLERRGIERLAALAVTHPDLDHDGGAAEVIERLAVGRLLGARLSPQSVGAARARGVPVSRIAAGDSLRSGRLRLEVLWPPADAPAAAGETNLHSLVLRARLGRFEMLLTGDAEAEAAPLALDAVDVLKVAHHGSEDAGLARLLASADPELAVISVGSANPYGHPAAATLAGLEAAGVPVLRTDETGEIAIDVAGDAWVVR